MSPRTWIRLVVLSGLLIALGFVSPGWSEAPKGKKYALLVGVTKYKRSTHFPDLKYTENDVEKLAPLLKKAGFASVRVLTSTRGEENGNDAPTAANVRKALAELVEDKDPRDTVLVALSGHGVEVEVEDPDGKGENKTYGYFCPSDADLVNVSYSTGKSKTLLHLGGLFDTLGKCGAGAKLVLIDACRDELKVKKEDSARSLDIKSIRIPDGVGVLFSCKSGQRAFETEKLKHGIFFHFVLEGLKGEAKNRRGLVTWDSLAAYVKDEVERQVPKLIRGGARQIPHLVANTSGTVVLGHADVGEPKPPAKEKIAQEKPPAKEKIAQEKPPKKIVKEKPAKRIARSTQPKSITNSIGMKLVLIPRGKFKMGSPRHEEARRDDEQQHEVEITKPFYLGVYEVTQKQYRQVMGENPSSFSRDNVSGVASTDDFPVDRVSWENAVAFCKKLSAREEEKKRGRKYRLPTEAEWEYACRGGTSTAYHFGNTISASRANYNANGLSRTCKVGSYRPNAFGLYDMHGNVLEWCSDWYDSGYYARSPRKDPRGPAVGSKRVQRGSSWNYIGGYLRSANRSSLEPNQQFNDIGFRAALVLTGE